MDKGSIQFTQMIASMATTIAESTHSDSVFIVINKGEKSIIAGGKSDTISNEDLVKQVSLCGEKFKLMGEKCQGNQVKIGTIFGVEKDGSMEVLHDPAGLFSGLQTDDKKEDERSGLDGDISFSV